MNIRRFLSLLGALALAVLPARAAVITQTVTQGAGTNWNQASWGTPVAIPAAGNSYITPAGFDVRTPDSQTASTFLGDSLQINSGGRLVLKNGGADSGLATANLILNGGSITYNTANGTTIASVGGTVQVISNSTINSVAGAATRDIWLRASVSGGSNLTVNLQTNSRSLVLLGTNSAFTGNWTLTAGLLEVGTNAVGPFGSGSVTLVNPTNVLTFNSPLDYTINNLISGNGSVTKKSSGSVVFTANNTWSNSLTVQAGFAALLGAGRQTNTVVESNGVLRLASSSAIPVGGALRVNSFDTQSGRIELSNNVTVAPGQAVILSMRQTNTPALVSLHGNNTISDAIGIWSGGGLPARIQVDAGSTLALAGGITSAITNSRSVALQGDGNGTVGGAIDNGLASSVALLKDGPGTWTLNGANTHSGATTISNGVLKLGASSTLANSSPVQVSGGTLDAALVPGGLVLGGTQTLAGRGTVLGSVTTSSGSAIEVGFTGQYGALALGNNLALAGGDTLRFDVGPGTNDVLNVTGSLTVNGVTTVAVGLPAGFADNGSYRLINYTGTLLGGGSFTVTAPASRQNFAIDVATAGQVNLVVTGNPTNLVWSGDGAFNAWDVGTTANWNGNAEVFYQADNVTFNDAGSDTPAIAIATPVQVSSFVVSNSVKTYTFTGSNITSSGTLTKRGNNDLILANDGNGFTGAINVEAGRLVIGNGGASGSLGAGNISNNGEVALNKSSGGVTLAGVVSGPGTVRVTGGGTLNLSGTNTHTGPTIVENGQLVLFNNNALGSTNTGTFVQAGGSVRFNSLGVWTLAEPIEINGDGLVSSAGALYANTDNNHVTVNGPVTLGSDSHIRIVNNNVVMNLAGPVTGADKNLTTTAATASDVMTFSNKLSLGTGWLTKAGPGQVVLAGSSNLTGGTVISDGTLVLTTTTTPQLGDVTLNAGTLAIGNGGANGALPPGAINLNGLGTTLRFNSSNNFVLNQPVSGAGGLTKQGAGTVIIATNTAFSGNLLAQDGLLVLTGSGAQGLTRVEASGVLRVASSAALPVGYLTRVNCFDIQTGRLELSNNVTLNTGLPLELAMRGNPTPALQSIAGNNTVADALSISTGGITPSRIQVDAGSTLTLVGGITATNGTRAFALQGAGTGVVQGAISNGLATSFSLLKDGAGTWTLNGANLHTGPTTIQGGTLALGPAASLSNSPSIQLLSNAVFNVSALGGGFTLDAAQTLSGNGTVQGSVLANGTVSPGTSIGQLNVSSTLTLAGTNTLEINRDQLPNADLIVAGALVHGGTLNVVNAGSALQAGDQFNLFDGPTTGAFAVTNLPALTSTNLAWDTSLLQSQGVVKVVSTALPNAPTILPPTRSGTNLLLQVASQTGFNYILQASAQLPATNWTALETNAGNGGPLTFTIPVTPGTPKQFFRLSVQ